MLTMIGNGTANRSTCKCTLLFLCLILTVLASPVWGAEPLRSDGWASHSHSKDADPDYSMVFAQDEVLRIDFVIAPEDWAAMLDDLYTNFAGGPGGDKGPDPNNQANDLFMSPEAPKELPLHIACCVGKSEGDATVLVEPNGNELSGHCVTDDRGTLVFKPDQPMPEKQPMPVNQSSGQPANQAMDQPFAPADQTFGFPNASGINPIYAEATCVFEGQTWEHVGIRFKGNSSLRDTAQSGTLKIPFHLEFDHFEDTYPQIDNQRFFGFKDLSLSNSYRDTTLVREKTANDLLRFAGVPSARSAFYRVYVDVGEGPQYFGLYTMTEIPGDPMLDTLFGNSGGNLYKPEGGSATFAYFDEGAFEKKTNTDADDWSDVQAVVDALNADRGDANAWRIELESVFDVQGFLRWLAVDTILGNWDTYGSMPHNFYVYNDEDDDLLSWIPWDNNEALSDWFSPVRSLSLDNVGEEWPLIRFLADDPVYYTCYLDYLDETLHGMLDASALKERVRDSWKLIQPYVVGSQGEQAGYTLLRNSQEFTQGLSQLLDYIDRRAQEVKAFLLNEPFPSMPIVISEIHYNPSSEQGDDDAFEFIELVNAGSSPILFDGFRFDDGIDFVFPDDVWLEPGRCLLVANDAAAYADMSCPVFEWTDGKLANSGERLSLVDVNGVVIDSVTYDDDAPWPELADGEGFSLVVDNADLANDLVFNWRASDDPGGTPGTVDD
jgi:CotH kinase protein/Lamin Tail Domain